jgi:hypothetical protein
LGGSYKILRENVLDLFRSDVQEIVEISSMANLVADRTARILLEYLLPEPETITKKTLDSQTKFYKDVGTIITTFIGWLDKTGDLSRGMASWKELEDRTEELRNEEIRRAASLIYELEFQDLLSYFFDFKLKGHKYVLSNLEKYLSADKIKDIESRAKERELELLVPEYGLFPQERKIHIPKYVPDQLEQKQEIPKHRYVPAEPKSDVSVPRYVPAEPEPESEASDENIGKIEDEEGDDEKK